MAKIETKHPGWQNVTRLGVEFHDGVGHTDDPAKVAFFRRHSGVYTVTEKPARGRNRGKGKAEDTGKDTGDKAPETEGGEQGPEPDAEDAGKAEDGTEDDSKG